MGNPIVSVIVPCYNQAQYLTEALASVLAQTYKHWECIIVNDGSSDNTEEVALEWIEQDERFKYIKQHNGGVSFARNIGINYSSGEFILPLDADDIIGKQYLEKAINHFLDSPQTKLVYCKAELFGEVIKEWELDEYHYENLLFGNMIFCSAIYSRKDFDETNRYNENMVHGLEDWDFWLTLLNESDIVYQIPETCFYYRIKDNSRTKNITNEKYALLCKQIVINHKHLYEKYLSDIIGLYSREKEQNKTILYINKELLKIKASKAYKLGKLILKPITKIRNVLTSNTRVNYEEK